MEKTSKKVLSIALCLALLLTSILFAAAAPQENTLKILVVSDIHYRPPEWLEPLAQVNNLPDDPLFRHTNTKGMLTYEADAILDTFFRQAEQSGAKYLLIPGDLSEEGHWEEHEGIAAKLNAFEVRSGITVFVLPGNHDIRTSQSKSRLPSVHETRLDLADFLDIYAELGYDKALARFPGDGSYTAELDESCRLLAIDACIYREDESYISPELFAWITAQIAQTKQDGKKLIAMTHYNVLDHFLLEGFTAGLLTIDQHRTLATLLADGGVKYVFTGHEHTNDIAYAETAQGNKIFDIETGSLITYPNAWREVDFSDSAVTVATKYVTEIDSSLLPQGFSEAQIRLMQKDFPSYSLRYFRAGIRSYQGMLPSLTETIAKALSTGEGTLPYELIDTMVQSLTQAIQMPLYGESGSVEALAKQAGITLAPSEYKDFLDLFGAFYAAHYAGNENFTMDSPQVKLLGQAFNAVLAAAALPPVDSLKSAAAKWLYARTLSKVVTNMLVLLIMEGVTSDWSAPDDLNAVLEPYGETLEISGPSSKITDTAFYLDLLRRAVNTVFNIVARIIKFLF